MWNNRYCLQKAGKLPLGHYLDMLTWAGALLICLAGIVATRQTETHILVDATACTNYAAEK